MSDQYREQSAGGAFRTGPEQRKLIRTAYRLVARQCQQAGTKIRQLEETLDRLRDRATIPTWRAAQDQIMPRYNVARASMQALEKSLSDLFATYY